MTREARVATLERRRRANPNVGPPPIEFFDRMLEDKLTDAEWRRWTPWLRQHPPELSDQQVERMTKATG